MGKASRFLKGLFGIKRLKENVEKSANSGDKKEEKKKWSFVKTGGDSGRVPAGSNSGTWLRSSSAAEQSKHAIAVAAATAAAADAAVAAAAAAAAVVRLTGYSGGARFVAGREKWAAVKIQTTFRGFLARKALRALKSLVKLQAHVRGYIVRKRAAATLHSMQALVRAQASIRARRARQSLREAATGHKFHSKRHDPGPIAAPKIVEIDPCSKSRSRRITLNDHMSSPLPVPNSTIPFADYPQFDWGPISEEFYKFATAQNTPRLSHSDRIAKAPTTPTRSAYGESLSGSNYPNYMTNTESFRAKVRSQSAPRQRVVVVNDGLGRRSSFSGVRTQQKPSWCQQVQQGC